MNSEQLKNEIAFSLQKIYDTQFMANMVELCQGEVRVLLYLCTCDDEMIFPTDISRELKVTRQRVTSILSGLRKKGYVHMELAENDRRRMNVKITSDGEDYIYAKKAEAERYFDLLIEKLGEDNIRSAIQLINSVANWVTEEELTSKL